MQEKITKSIIKKVVPIYGKVFKDPSLALGRIEQISSDSATQSERTEYYNCGVIAFKLTGIAFIIPFLAIFIGSLAVFRSFNFFIVIAIFIFTMLLSIGLTFELLKLKNEKTPQIYTKKELRKGILIGICSTIFFSYMVYVGVTYP